MTGIKLDFLRLVYPVLHRFTLADGVKAVRLWTAVSLQFAIKIIA